MSGTLHARRSIIGLLMLACGIIGWQLGRKGTQKESPSRAPAASIPPSRPSAPAPTSAEQQVESLRAKPPAVASQEIQQLLKTGQSQPLSTRFALGANGRITSSSTTRAALLDLLFHTDLEAALRESRVALEQPIHPDEWAVAMRNLGRGDKSPDTTALLRKKALEALNHQPWLDHPTESYFQLFDVLVHTNATDAIPRLVEFLGDKKRTDLGYAAFLTLDRLMMREPLAVMEQLLKQYDVFKTRPEMAANVFARADIHDADQRKALESYLLDPTRTAKEWHAFASIFPNQNSIESNNLLTSSLSPLNQVKTDDELIRWLEALRTKPQLSAVREELAILTERVSLQRTK